MNSMERMLCSLSHKQPDRVPVYPILSGVTRKLVGATYEQWSVDPDVYAASLLKSAEVFDIDCLVTLIDLSVECDAWGQKLIYPKNEAAHPDYSQCVIQTIEDYANIKKTDFRSSKRMMMHIEACKKILAGRTRELPVIAFVFGPLGTLSMMRNQQELYMDLYDDPKAVKRAVEVVTETLIDYCGALIDTGVHAIMLDTLFSSGSIMSKSMWKEMEGVYVKRLADSIHARGCIVMIHNCGKNIYFDAQIEAMRPQAISFLYPPDDCADFVECKKKYGDQITLIGCVPPSMVVTATDEEWAAECRRQIDIMAPGGGFMLATGCEYPANASLDRAEQMVDIAKTYGKY